MRSSVTLKIPIVSMLVFLEKLSADGVVFFEVPKDGVWVR